MEELKTLGTTMHGFDSPLSRRTVSTARDQLILSRFSGQFAQRESARFSADSLDRSRAAVRLVRTIFRPDALWLAVRPVPT